MLRYSLGNKLSRRLQRPKDDNLSPLMKGRRSNIYCVMGQQAMTNALLKAKAGENPVLAAFSCNDARHQHE